MDLGFKASRLRSARQGYAMAALLVAMSVMSILMAAALQTWAHMIRREKEEELIFRGRQYARAINLYQRRYANASPPNLDVLIEQHFLRKKYKDPLSPNEDGEFELLTVNSQDAGAGRQGGVGSLITPGGRSGGPIIGVASKNTGDSIRVYEGKTKYNEWQFIGLQQSTRGGGSGTVSTVIEGGSSGTTFTGPDGRTLTVPPGQRVRVEMSRDGGGRGGRQGGQPPPQRGGQFDLPARGR
jgi:type II secretory pathway pseudopilin PulG